LKYSETLRALRETETNQHQQQHNNRDARGLKEVRPAAPVKVVASNPHFKVGGTFTIFIIIICGVGGSRIGAFASYIFQS
jgi:hypothetical protein